MLEPFRPMANTSATASTTAGQVPLVAWNNPRRCTLLITNMGVNDIYVLPGNGSLPADSSCMPVIARTSVLIEVPATTAVVSILAVAGTSVVALTQGT